jgi:hypothetical protein
VSRIDFDELRRPLLGRDRSRAGALRRQARCARRHRAVGPESAAATRHEQPTPGSIAAAESRLGDFSAATVAAIKADMTRAREADRAGDAAACEQALAGVRRAIGP